MTAIGSGAKTQPEGDAEVAIASSKRRPSKLTLPVVEDINVPTELPPGPGLRGQPCRDYEPMVNRKPPAEAVPAPAGPGTPVRTNVVEGTGRERTPDPDPSVCLRPAGFRLRERCIVG